MKKFLTYATRWIGTVIAILLVSDACYTYIYTHAPARNKFEYIMQLRPTQIDAVFLGSSRTANHIVTQEVVKITHSSAINLGIEGALLEDNLLELKLLLSRKVKIKTVFLQVDYVFEAGDGVSNIANSSALPFIHDPVVAAHLKPQLPDFTEKYYIPFYRYLTADYAIGFRDVFLTAIHKKPKVNLDDGFSPKKGRAGFKKIALPATVASQNKTITAFRVICAAQHIRLLLFCAPFCSQTIHLDYIGKLKKKLPDLRDYSTALPDSLFYNCKHLNADGAVLFTRALIEDDRRMPQKLR